MKKNINKKASSILIAILLTGFLLIMVIGMFKLMIRDMKDNKGSQNYIKAYAGAEGAMELGLLKIKEKGYGIDKDLELTNSGILSFDSPLNNNDPRINYKMDIGTKSYSGTLLKGATVIIPLFSNGIGIKKPTFTGDGDIIWNIIGTNGGMSGTGNFQSADIKNYRNSSGEYTSKSIQNFLLTNTGSYLMLFNKSNSDEKNYKLEAESNFSKPVGRIISSAQVGRFRQNINTNIDNTEFLNMLKYSLYSK